MMSIAVKLDVTALLEQENRLLQVHPMADQHLELSYSDGTRYCVDMKPYIRLGTPAAALGDPRIFATVRLARRGLAIEFEGGVDFCADALRLDAELELHGMTRADVEG